MPPHLVVVGVSHRRAGVFLRERLAIPAYHLADALADLRHTLGLREEGAVCELIRGGA